MAVARRASRSGRETVGLVEVARRAGVSTATVSRVLNSSGQVSAETRRRVERVVADLDFAPNSFARALASRRSAAIGVIVPSLRGSIFAAGVEAIQRHGLRQGYTVVLACHDYDLDRELALARSLVARGVDGLVLFGALHHPDLAPMMAHRGAPYVCQGAFDRRGPHACVGFDNAAAMERVIDHLLALGHTRIAVLAGVSAGNDRVRDRIDGARRALARGGAPLGPGALVESRYDVGDARRAAARLLALEPRPTAIACINDVLALGAVFECQAREIAIPGEVSIIGFDDLDFAVHMHPHLTTMRVPTTGMGERALDQLIARIEGKAGVAHAVEMSTELVIRASTGPPPDATARP